MASRLAPTPASSDTLEMSVANMSFMLDRLGQDCSPLQFLRELTQNAIESIERVPSKTGEVTWDVDWNRHTLTGVYKLCVMDTGVGMTGPEMKDYINKLSSSVNEQTQTGNFGVGAKIAAAPRNHAGLLYLSWKDSVGSMIHMWRDPESGKYGLRKFDRPDGTFDYWGYISDDIKPEAIKDHGTMVVLLGDAEDADTMQMPEGGSTPSRWVSKYLNQRYFKFPKGVTVRSREGWTYPLHPDEDTHTNILRTLTGQAAYLDAHASSSGTVKLADARVHWWILKDDSGIVNNHSFVASSGHVAALFKDELYEMATSRAGVAKLQAFGVIFGCNRVVLYVEPEVGERKLTPNTARTHLLLDGEPLPWTEWASQFRQKMPEDINQLMETVGAGTSVNDHRQSIRDRLKQIRDLFRITRYRPSARGELSLDEESMSAGGSPAATGKTRGSHGEAGGGRGGRAGDIYALFLTARGVPGEELLRQDADPNVRWISTGDATRTPPDLEDRAAKFLPQLNMILVNADFRVFTDMVDRWCEKYKHVRGARPAVEQVVREWFEQQLVETVLGIQALQGSRQWTLPALEAAWSEEALTAAVMPRYHVDNNVKRALGAKLGTLKDVA